MFDIAMTFQIAVPGMPRLYMCASQSTNEGVVEGKAIGTKRTRSVCQEVPPRNPPIPDIESEVPRLYGSNERLALHVSEFGAMEC